MMVCFTHKNIGISWDIPDISRDIHGISMAPRLPPWLTGAIGSSLEDAAERGEEAVDDRLGDMASAPGWNLRAK